MDERENVEGKDGQKRGLPLWVDKMSVTGNGGWNQIRMMKGS